MVLLDAALFVLATIIFDLRKRLPAEAIHLAETLALVGASPEWRRKFRYRMERRGRCVRGLSIRADRLHAIATRTRASRARRTTSRSRSADSRGDPSEPAPALAGPDKSKAGT
jgi:hypothetical protein